MASGNFKMRARFERARHDPDQPSIRRQPDPTHLTKPTFPESGLPPTSSTSRTPPTAQSSGDIQALREPALPYIDSRCGALTRTLIEATSEGGGAAGDTTRTRQDPLSIRLSNATSEGGDASLASAKSAEPVRVAGNLSTDAAARIFALTDTRDLHTVDDALSRIDEIATLFAKANDARGIFPVTYRVITQRARQGVENKSFVHDDWARALIVQFAERFLVNLRAHLSGEDVSPAWKTYFDRADDTHVSVAGVLGSGIFAHLVDDLPLTLADLQSKPEQSEDFTKFGLLLLEVYPELVEAVGQNYGADVSSLLSGFSAGRLIDHVWGDGSTTELLFQSIRKKAWIMGQRLQKDCTREIARFEMEQSLAVLQFALRGLT